MTTLTRISRDEAGFTLAELLVAMTISIVVLLATLYSLDTFSSNAAQQSRVNDANDQLRSTMDRTVADLRSASQILGAAATDLSYAVPLTSGYRVERLCVAVDKTLYGASTTTAGAPTAPAGACTGTKLASLKSTTTTTFSYDGVSASATPETVKNVGLTFSLDTSGGGHVGASTLKASAARRSAGTLPITSRQVLPKCGNGVAILSLSATIPNVATMNVAYTAGGVTLNAVGTAAVQFTVTAGVITPIIATITDALGVTNTIQKDVLCD